MSLPNPYGGFAPTFTFGTGPQKPLTKEQQLEAELAFAKQRIQEICSGATHYGVILGVQSGKTMIQVGNETFEVATPSGSPTVEPGDAIRVVVQRTQQGQAAINIIEVIDDPCVAGPIVSVKQKHGDRIEVELPGGQSKLVACKGSVKPGDRVLLDTSMCAAIKNLGAAADSSRVFTQDTGVSWDDIGGNDEAKQALREAIEYPVLHKETYARFGIKASKGVLLWGPPGTGKTMLAKACATALAKVHGDAALGGFIYVKGPELVNHFAGVTEGNIRRIFEQARAFRAKTGVPAIVFFDEADALFGKRGSRTPGLDSLQAMVIPALLAEMDGLFDTAAFVLLATNRPDALDPAVVREGRIDKKIHVKRPTQGDVASIVSKALRGKPCDAPGEVLSEKAAASLFASHRTLYTLQMKSGPERRLVLGDVTSGAMAVAIADRAVARAMRDALAGIEDRVVTSADLEGAIDEVQAEQQSLDHSEDLRQLAEGGEMVGAEDLRKKGANKGPSRILLLDDILREQAGKVRH